MKTNRPTPTTNSRESVFSGGQPMRPGIETVRLVGPARAKSSESMIRLRPTDVHRSVRRAVHNIHIFGAFLGIMAIMFFLLGIVFGIPIEPRPGHWPTYGLVLLVPGMSRIFVGYIAEKASRAQHHAIILGLCTGLALLDAYGLLVLLAWIVGYVGQTLSPGAFKEFGVGAHLMMIVGYLVLVCFGIFVVVKSATAYLLLQFGIETRQGNDHDEDDDEDDDV